MSFAQTMLPGIAQCHGWNNKGLALRRKWERRGVIGQPVIVNLMAIICLESLQKSILWEI